MKIEAQLKKVIWPILFILVALDSHAYVNGNYPRLATMRIGDDQQMLASSNNIFSYAVENGKSVPLKYEDIRGMTSYLFRKEYFDSYIGKKLNNPAFVKGVRAIVFEFGCAEYRYRHRLPETDSCSGFVSNINNIEKMPFVNGQFKTSRLEQHIDSKRYGVSYHFYLPSTSEKNLDTLWGAVHELGSFFGRTFDNKQLVLSIYMQAYPLNERGFRDSIPFYDKSMVYFIVLPSAVEIYKQQSEEQAGHFVVNNAKMLILGKKIAFTIASGNVYTQ